jgi:hypothetical protein
VNPLIEPLRIPSPEHHHRGKVDYRHHGSLCHLDGDKVPWVTKKLAGNCNGGGWLEGYCKDPYTKRTLRKRQSKQGQSLDGRDMSTKVIGLTNCHTSPLETYIL